MLGDAQHVAGEVVELQRAVVVVGIAVAARVPGSGLEVVREEFDLAGPVAPVAADAVEKEDEGPAAGDRDSETRCRFDENRFQVL
jgi:hypothetical protein